MKILKKHGKKVSVMLLAIALMISPMLPIVKAADNDTCEKRFHYYFLLAEEAYIDHADTNNQKVYRSYSGEYPQYFGLTPQEVEGNTVFKDLLAQGYHLRDDGEAVTTFDGETKAEAVDQQGSGMKTFDGTYYNVELPEGYTLKDKNPTITEWSDKDWDRYVEMYKKLLKVHGDKQSFDATADETSIVAGDDDIYFIHFSWQEANEQKWNDSDMTHALATLFASLEDWTESGDIKAKDVQTSITNQIKNASLKNVATTVSLKTNADIENLGHDSSSIIAMTIHRNVKGIEKPKAFYGWMDKTNDPTWNEDNKYWFFAPVMATYTFTASGDVCNTNGGPGVIDTSEESTKNPGTGIVSYAIIGTLLVGAASAYIYARKNNKFNKV